MILIKINSNYESWSYYFFKNEFSRLPGKAFKDVSGKFLLERVIDRTIKVNLVDHVCLATSTNCEDDKIVKYAKDRGLDVSRKPR